MKVFARVPFTYMGQDLDRGEILEMRGSPRDSSLMTLRYLIPYDVRIHHTKQCDSCGRKFMGDSHLTEHRRKPNCTANVQEINSNDLAESLGVDLERVSMPD